MFILVSVMILLYVHSTARVRVKRKSKRLYSLCFEFYISRWSNAHGVSWIGGKDGKYLWASSFYNTYHENQQLLSKERCLPKQHQQYVETCNETMLLMILNTNIRKLLPSTNDLFCYYPKKKIKNNQYLAVFKSWSCFFKSLNKIS